MTDVYFQDLARKIYKTIHKISLTLPLFIEVPVLSQESQWS
jgi:hypothetical protein